VKYIKIKIKSQAFKHPKEPSAQKDPDCQFAYTMIGTSMHSVEANVTKHKNGHAACYVGRGVEKGWTSSLLLLSMQ
jgi:hypothetical protein